MNPSEELAKQYSARADAYAELWAPVLLPMAKQLLPGLPLKTARRILDVGAGTGGFMSDLAGAAPEATIVGVDRAEQMLRVARERGPHPLAVMDAQQLALRSETFDVAVLVFVLFHMLDPRACLVEVRRTLHAGGVVGLVTWGEGPDIPGQSIWTEELDARGADPDPRDASVMQHARMDTPEKVTSLVLEAGYVSARVWSMTFEYHWTVEQLLAIQVGCGMAGRRLVSLPASARAACRKEVEARLARLTEESLVYRPDVLFTTAKRPL